MSPLFYFLATLTLAGAIAAMSLRNPVHCALCLVATFAGLAGLYLNLGAQFLGLAQVLVYIGAVAILLVFVLMVTRTGGKSEDLGLGNPSWRLGVSVAVLVAAVLTAAVWSGGRALPVRDPAPALPAVRDLGEALMTDYVLPLQAIGVLLTAAMIGAAIIALRDRRPAVTRKEAQG